MQSDAIVETLELVAAHVGDPTSLVYARLFAAHPEMERLFAGDTSGAVRGHMLATAVENLLDLAGANAYAANMLHAERVNHENLGVPAEVFPAFYGALADTFRAVLGTAWTPGIEAAWIAALARVNEVVSRD
jgi:hemoglobin-like flavoprotein